MHRIQSDNWLLTIVFVDAASVDPAWIQVRLDPTQYLAKSESHWGYGFQWFPNTDRETIL